MLVRSSTATSSLIEHSDFQVATNTLFATKASKTVDVVNSRLSAGLTRLDSKLKFVNITYVCKHGGVVRKTGTGIRPQQRTMKKDCPAKITVTTCRANQLLEVTVVNLEHNHEVSPETYKAYSECRQLNEEEVNFVRPLIELNNRPSLIVEKLRQEAGKAVTAKDIQNLKCARQGEDEAIQLLQEMNNLKAKYGAKVLPITDENKELQILFFQTPHMQQAFKCFPEVVLLDATYRTNKLHMPAFVMVVEFLEATEVNNHEEVDADLESTTGSSAEEQVLSMPGPSFQKMDRNQRFNYAMRTLKAIADNLADCQPNVFAPQLSFLESVNTAWLRQEEVTLSNHEKDEVQAPENSTFQGVGSGDTLHIDGAQKLLNQSQPSVTTEPSMSGSDTGSSANEKCSARPSISGSDTRGSANQKGTASSPVSEIKLPLVKSRGRPSKRVLQSRLKRPREQDDARPVRFKQLSEKSQTQLILSGLIGDSLCPRVLDGAYILQEHDLEVRPEALPSALLDCREKTRFYVVQKNKFIVI
ncbi:hypothetical protein HPB51_002321 [Rhipicephalus microplus]|uniref:Uncharacterized protein n=1 Tax=Rhipicephalus microplus TaxID=6941 RepID=A0A9J6DYZ6_RHIMP|nr:hypothetical protein HPB51_002321 [Rhipicephalus microplus]